MVLFFSHYQLILIPLWPVLWDYKVPIFEVPIMGTFTNSDVVSSLHPFLLRIISFMICKVVNNGILFLDYADVLSSEFSRAFACDTEG